jgi:MFS family permease
MSEIDTAPDLARDVHPSRWRILALLATAELLGMSLWFAASAIAPQLQHLWHLSASETGWLTAIVQLGFVAGTAAAALLNLADVISSRAYFAGAAALGALVNAALLIVPGYRSALVLRFATGFCLAGVYPPAMKMISTWFRSQRGLAIGTIVGALTVGKATPYLVHALEGAGIAPVILVASAAALAYAMLVASGYRDGTF